MSTLNKSELAIELPIIISKIEKRFRIKIVMVTEIGSRAHGLVTATSDYDIRFIYINHSTYYLGIVTDTQTKDAITHAQIKRSDVLDNVPMGLATKLDIQGWELRKMAGKIASSNITPLEWINTKTKYLDLAIDPDPSPYCHWTTKFSEFLRGQLVEHLDVRTLLDGYSGQAGTFLKELRTPGINPIKPLMGMVHLWHCYNWVITHKDDSSSLSTIPLDHLKLMSADINIYRTLGPKGCDYLLELIMLRENNTAVCLNKHDAARAVYNLMHNWVMTATMRSSAIAPTKNIKNNYNFSLAITEIIKRFI
jgi:hypothetical protein